MLNILSVKLLCFESTPFLFSDPIPIYSSFAFTLKSDYKNSSKCKKFPDRAKFCSSNYND